MRDFLTYLNSARFWRAFALARIVVASVQVPLVLFLVPEWRSSVVYLIFLSQVTWISGEIAAWQATRVEVKQDAPRKD